MSPDRPPLAGHPETCGCCEGLGVGTPAEVYNRPGLSAIAYRIGTHARFKQSMLAHLSDSRLPALRGLNTREDDDFAISLIDAWATVAEVLTFYSERVANESYLRTATERVSLLHLARLIGYELAPGVAANAHLAFDLEDVPGAPTLVTVGRGTAVQSLPGQDERPQTFETVEEIQARPEWNRLRPRLAEPKKPDKDDTKLYLAGVDTQLQPGDAILLVGDEREENPGSERWDFRVLREVTPHPPEGGQDEGYTLVEWERGLGHEGPTVEPADNPKVYALRQRAALFGYNAPEWKAMPTKIQRAYDPDYDVENDEPSLSQWPRFEIRTVGERLIDLDAVYPKVLPGSWVVLARPGYEELYRVQSAAASSRTDFTLSAKTTRVELDSREHLNYFGLRSTAVHAQSEPLEIAEYPVEDPVESDQISLDRPLRDFDAGRTIIVSGKRTRVTVAAEGLSLTSEDKSRTVDLQPGDSLQAAGPRQEVLPETGAATDDRLIRWHLVDGDGFVGFVTAGEGGIVLEPAREDDETVSEVAHAEASLTDDAAIVLGEPLRNSYDRATTIVYANVARATHGETEEEVLGSGDASATFQSFTLREAPLTYTSATTPSGTESTLEVRVNDVRWHEVADLYGRGREERIFVTRRDAEGRTTVRFGDGRTGARLPTGQENVRAAYRKGIGLAGLVRAGQLSLLTTPVLGVRGVNNPLAPSRADDPEFEDEARRNAPLTVLTLDRVVSLGDYEDFARAYAGIAKAHATWIWTGETREVLVTVAAPQDRNLDEDLLEDLVTALRAVGDRHLPLKAKAYKPASFGVGAKIKTDPDHVREAVIEASAAALRTRFGFEARSFGQGVALSEVVTVLQGVPGVVMVDVDELYRLPKDEEEEQPQPFLVARVPRPGQESEDVLPAELLTLDPDELVLEVIG